LKLLTPRRTLGQDLKSLRVRDRSRKLDIGLMALSQGAILATLLMVRGLSLTAAGFHVNEDLGGGGPHPAGDVVKGPRSAAGVDGGHPRALAGHDDDEHFKLADSFGGVAGFYHGVASGEPLLSAVVIWTRYTPMLASDEIEVVWRMAPIPDGATAADMADLLHSDNTELVSGMVTTTSSEDWTVKVDVQGLTPGTEYVYGFAVNEAGAAVSPVGMTRTAPTDGEADSMRYATFAHTNFQRGYFHAYDVGSTVEDLDFWIHVSEYFDEYRHGYWTNVRGVDFQIEPNYSCVTVQDYRLRLAFYRMDEALQNLHRAAPVFALWSRVFDGSQSSSPTAFEDWLVRAEASAHAWYQWMPVRDMPNVSALVLSETPPRVYEWGNLGTIVLADSHYNVPFPGRYLWAFPEVGHGYGWALYLGNWTAYMDLLTTNTDPLTWLEEPLLSQFEEAAAVANAALFHNDSMSRNDTWSQHSSHIPLDGIREALSASKAAGKPWQILVTSSQLYPWTGPNFEYIPTLLGSSAFRSYLTQVYTSTIPLPGDIGGNAGNLVRRLTASALFKVINPGYPMNYNDFLAEKIELVNTLKEHTNNAVHVGFHAGDAFGSVIYEGIGFEPTTPVAVELTVGRVSEPGETGDLMPLLQPLAQFGADPWMVLDATLHQPNPGIKYVNGKDAGFVVATVYADKLISDFIHINDDYTASSASDAYLSMSYEEARNHTGTLAAPYYCGGSFETAAGEPGSMVSQASCHVSFAATRPLAWSEVVNPMITTAATTGATTIATTTVTIASSSTTSVTESEEMSTTTVDDMMNTTTVSVDDVSSAVRGAFVPFLLTAVAVLTTIAPSSCSA